MPYHQMRSAGHPAYQALDTILRDAGFDKNAEKLCSRSWAVTLHGGIEGDTSTIEKTSMLPTRI